jgi:hypothetical protein
MLLNDYNNLDVDHPLSLFLAMLRSPESLRQGLGRLSHDCHIDYMLVKL